MKPYLFLIRGLPGSGKSTLATFMLESFQSMGMDAMHFEADMWMQDEEGNYVFDPTRLVAAHKACQTATEDFMKENAEAIIVSNTFVRKWEMHPYAALAGKYGYQIVIIEARGNYKSVHNVPDETMARMHANWETV